MREIAAAALLFFGAGCDLLERWASRPGELKAGAKMEEGREESILQTHFPYEMTQKMLAHLATSDLSYFESVSQPRPAMEPIRASHGEPDSIRTIDLAPFGVPQRARAHDYGRLVLLTPDDRDDEVFWVLIAAIED